MGADIEHPYSVTKNGLAFLSFQFNHVLSQGSRGFRGPWVSPMVWEFMIAPGSRFYVDHTFLENATPECDAAEDVVAYIHAGYRRLSAWLAEYLDKLRTSFPGEHYEVNLYASNISGLGPVPESCGSHENYQIIADDIRSFGEALVGYFVSDVPLYGAGRLRHDGEFELSQRAGFFTQTFSKNTMKDRGIINLRDEPHATGSKRFHVIARDNSINPELDILKRKDLQVLLTMREEGQLRGLMPEDPPRALQAISLNPGTPVPVHGRGLMTAVEMAHHYYEQQMSYLTRPRNQDLADGFLPWIKLKGEHLKRLGHSLDPDNHCWKLDWATRQVILDQYRARGLSGRELYTRDIQLQKINGQDSGWVKLMRRYQLDEAAVQRALAGPPATTRARARAELLQKYGSGVHQAGWDWINTEAGQFLLPDPLDPTIPDVAPVWTNMRLVS